MAETGSVMREASGILPEFLDGGVSDSVGVRCDRTLLGIPTVLICEGAAEQKAVQAASARWTGGRDPTASALTIELRTRPDVSNGSSVEYVVLGSRMTLRGGGVDGLANAATRTARCTISPDLFARPDDLLALVLEPLVLFLATHNGRVPIHASAIRVGNLAILFAGASGAGKSSLALAAHRAGLSVLSEDTVYIRPGPSPAIWGWNGPVHVLPQDTANTASAIRIRNGRVKHAIALEPTSAIDPPANSAVVCVLGRAAHPALTRLKAQAALHLLHPLEPGFDLLQAEIHSVHRQLCGKGAWLLGLSGDAREAIALISANIGRLRRSAN
jgi:hypothetical protein